MAHYSILDERIKMPVCGILKVFNVSKSGYYSWLKRYNNPVENKEEIEEKEIVEKMKAIIKKLGFVPGKRMFVDYFFRDYNELYDVRKIKRIMDKYNFKANRPKKDAYKGKATHNHECACYQNYVDQDFKKGPRQVILTDITYLYFGKKRNLFYLCCFKDAYTNEILGFSIDKRMTVSLVIDAYEMMMESHSEELKKEPKVYIHSDQGSQYLSTTFSKILKDDGFVQSTSARGNSQDNAPMESFFGRMKTAILDIIALCPCYDKAVELVSNYIESYNNQYQHVLACLSPKEFYKYSTTGIYPLDSYYGIKADDLLTVEDIVKAELERQQEKKNKRKEANRKKRIERANLDDPLSIVVRDIAILNNKINKYDKKIDILNNKKRNCKDIIKEAEVAYEFICSASDEIIEQLKVRTNWINYEQLHYVYRMRGFF